jgi:hypothetical protein
MRQLALTYTERRSRNLDILTRAMRLVLDDGAWHTAASIRDRMGLSDRSQRAVAEHSQGQIISGQQGYKLTRAATCEELDRAEAWLLSQARHMVDRARQIRLARNRREAA